MAGFEVIIYGRFWVITEDNGSVANEGWALGHCRFDRQGKTAANSAGAVMVQATSGCLAPAFGREQNVSQKVGDPKRKVQSVGFDLDNATRAEAA